MLGIQRVSGEGFSFSLFLEDNTCWMATLPSSSSDYVTSLSNRVLILHPIEAGEWGEHAVLGQQLITHFEEKQLNSLAEISQMTTLVLCEDRYVWTLESDGVFSVASIRKEIDGNRFQVVGLPP
ncbi:hypothetical protein Tco_0349013, partial [Tanacetum coccineum]